MQGYCTDPSEKECPQRHNRWHPAGAVLRSSISFPGLHRCKIGFSEEWVYCAK